MPGGLLQLVAYGSQDAILTMNPEYTFFKSVYHRYANFSKTSEKIYIENSSNFNEVTKITIPKKADLLDNIYAIIKIPKINIKYKFDKFEEILKNKNKIYISNNLDDCNYYYQILNLLSHVCETDIYKNLFGSDSNGDIFFSTFNLFNFNKNTVENQVTIYPEINSNLIKNQLNDSLIFFDFNILNNENEKVIKLILNNFTNNNFYKVAITNLIYLNNFYQIVNYLNEKSAIFNINTPNQFIENLYFLVLKYYSGIKPANYLQNINVLNNTPIYVTSNILTFNLLSSSRNIKNGKLIDFDRSIYGTNLIKINFNNDFIYSNKRASDFDIIFIMSQNTSFNLTSILSILKKREKIKNSEFILYELHTNELTLSENFTLTNYLNIDNWPLNKNNYLVTSKKEISNYKNIFELKLNNYNNLVAGQLLFAFIGDTNSNDNHKFTLKILKINNESIETCIFENNLNSNKINTINENLENYSGFPLTHISVAVSFVNPVSYKNINSDMYENYIYLNNSEYKSISSLNDELFYRNLITSSKLVIQSQFKLISNYINSLFSGFFYVSTNFQVNQSTFQVSNYFETNFYEEAYTKYVNNFVLKESSNLSRDLTYSNSVADYNYIKYVRKLVDYLITPSTISGTSNFKSNITEKFGSLIVKGLDNSNQLIDLINKIKYLQDIEPFITIQLGSLQYNNGTDIKINEIVYAYNSLNDKSNNKLVTIFKVKGIDTVTKELKLSLNTFISANQYLNFDVKTIDSLNDNFYIFLNDNSNVYVQVNGNIFDQSSFTVTLSNILNNTGTSYFYKDFSNASLGENTQNEIEIGVEYNIFRSTTKTLDLNIFFLCKMKLIRKNGNQLFFILDSKDDNNVIFDTTNFFYFAFKIDNNQTNFSKGLYFNNVTIDSRFFSLLSLDVNSVTDTSYRGYKYTNILYIITALYLYDELKSSSDTIYNNILLKRLLLISCKIHQIISNNSNHNVQVESSAILNRTTLKLTCLLEASQIFNSSTIINELLTESSDVNINNRLISNFKSYLNGKVINIIPPTITNRLNNINFYDNSIYTSSNKTSNLTNELYETFYTTQYQSGLIEFNLDTATNKLKRVYRTSNIEPLEINDSEVLNELKLYLKFVINQLSENIDISDVSNLVNIRSSKLYFISANDVIMNEYLRSLDYYYYDDFLTKESFNIGINLNQYVNSENILKSDDIRKITENRINIFNEFHSLSNKTSLNEALEKFYLNDAKSFNLNFTNYLSKEEQIINIKNLDIKDDLSMVIERNSNNQKSLINKIYNNMNLTVGLDNVFDSLINLVFSDYEIDKTIYNFVNIEIVKNNDIFNYLKKITLYSSFYQIYSIFLKFTNSLMFNKLIDNLTMSELNATLSNDNFSFSDLNLNINLDNQYDNLVIDTTQIYVPKSKINEFRSRITYIKNLSDTNKLIEKEISTLERFILFQIKNFYEISSTEYPSLKSLELYLNENYLKDKNFKILRGTLLTNDEFNLLNHDPISVNLSEITNYKGLKSIIVPLNILNIFNTGLLVSYSMPELKYDNNEEQVIRFAKNISSKTELGTNEIGTLINGEKINSYISNNIPNESNLNTIYELVLESNIYFNYHSNIPTNISIQVGDNISFYSTSLISLGNFIINSVVVSVSGNIIKISANSNINFRNYYGYKNIFINSQLTPSYKFGFKIISSSYENFSINLVSYLDKFSNFNNDSHYGVNEYGESGYYTGKLLNDLKNLKNSYIKNTQYLNDNLRHIDGHSKIIGISYDGYPIYGPFGYTDPKYSTDLILVNDGINEKSYYNIEEVLINIESSNTIKISINTFDNGNFKIKIEGYKLDYRFNVDDIIYIENLKDTFSLWKNKYNGYWKIKNIFDNELFLQGSTYEILNSDKVELSSNDNIVISIKKLKSNITNESIGVTKKMKSSYKFISKFSNNRINLVQIDDNKITKFNKGSIIGDYEFSKSNGDLDECNGRFCNTPEFPMGTYAYFITLDDNMEPEFPYIIGPNFYNVKSYYNLVNTEINQTAKYLISTQIKFISKSSNENRLEFEVLSNGSFKIKYNINSDFDNNSTLYLNDNDVVKIIFPKKNIYTGYWKIINKVGREIFFKGSDTKVTLGNNIIADSSNICTIKFYKSSELKGTISEVNLNVSNKNYDTYNNKEILTPIFGNGKYGTCELVKDSNLINRIKIVNEGIEYKTGKLFLFKNRLDSLDFVDGHQFTLKRKTKFDDGYYFNYDTNKLDIHKFGSNLDQPHFDSAVQKLNNFVKNFNSLNLDQNFFTKGNKVFTSVNTQENILLGKYDSLIISSSTLNIRLNVESTGIFKISFNNLSDEIKEGDIIYLHINMEIHIDKFRNFFKVKSVSNNEIVLNGSNVILTTISEILFNSVNSVKIYVYKSFKNIYDINFGVNSSQYLTLKDETQITSQNKVLKTIADGIFTITLDNNIFENGDIINISGANNDKYNGYFVVKLVNGNVLTLNASTNLFKVNTTDLESNTSINIVKFKRDEEVEHEDIFNILSIYEITSQLGTIDPKYYNNLSDVLYSSINNKYDNFNLIINNLIQFLISENKDFRIFYNEEIYIEKDINLSNLLNLSNILELIGNSKSDNNNLLLKNSLRSILNLQNTNLTNKDNFFKNKKMIMERELRPKFSWIKNLGNYIFSEIELYFNDLQIDKHYASWINIWNELNVKNNTHLFNKMIGNVDELTTLNNLEKNSYKLIIPFRFWFCRSSGLNLPLIAMINTMITLKLKVNDINNLVRKPENTEVIISDNPKIELSANYIYLDDNERKLFAEARHEYLIEQIQFNSKTVINNLSETIEVYFKNNIKDMIWFLDHEKNLIIKDQSDYTSNNKNPFLNVKIVTNSKNLISQDGKYFNYVIPYERYNSSPSEGVNVYSFGLNNNEYQPSGTINFSMIDKVEMELKMDPSVLNLNSKQVLVFGTSYNILRIMSGHTGIAFIQ